MSFPAADTWPEMPKFLSDLPKPGPDDITNPGSPVKFQWEAHRAGPSPIDDAAGNFPLASRPNS